MRFSVCSSTADYVILSLVCFPLTEGFEVQNFELVPSQKRKLACFMLNVKDERKKSEVKDLLS